MLRYEDPTDCPYPDCDGWLNVRQEMYGTDADGRRGILEAYVECTMCERDPDDYDPSEWEDYDDGVG